MYESAIARPPASRASAAGALLGLAAAAVGAQGLPSDTMASDPNPYYLGIGETITHDSNVFQTPDGPSDNYSSTSLFGGFDQRISRQRIFGRASISANRYQDQSSLNNTSYDLGTGLAWETIGELSGGLNASITRRLAAPTASVGVPSPVRNVADLKSVDTQARWGGASLLSLDGGLSYSQIDYSAPEFVTAESRQESANLGITYRPGAFLRVGAAVRLNRSKTPKALLDPVSGEYQSNTIKGKNLDLNAGYTVSGFLVADARVSYTKQSNSGISSADFSGLTGSLGLTWQPTAKISVRIDGSRDAGFDASLYNLFPQQAPQGPTPSSPVVGLYENNRITNSAGVSLVYSATAKITGKAGARYTRAKLVTTSVSELGTSSAPDTIDTLRSYSLGVSYAINRAWGAGCDFGHDSRDVTGNTAFAYSANRVGCSTQFTWR